jgi:peptidoglycan/xylan/chitin deacetylase (PgdA/CDA1 family)
MITSIASAGLIGFGAYFSPHVERLRSVKALKKLVRANRTLILTYDDGPSDSVTPKLLSLLRSHGAHATFFMLGRSAKQFPSVADRVLQEGHEIGCHTDSHLNAWKTNPWRAIADIDAGYSALSTWVPSNGTFRPPYGKITLPTYLAIRRRGASLGWWTIDSGDTHDRLPHPQKVAETAVNDGGGIVLMHDLDHSPERNDFVLETTSVLLKLATREAFTIKRLSDLCH